MINATGNRMTQEIQRQARLAQAMGNKQAQISSGKRIQRASDDSLASARVATLKTAQANDAALLSNINLGIALTGQADGHVRNMSDLVSRARELTVSAGNSALSPSDRGTIAAEISALADEIDAIALVRNASDEPLFAAGSALSIRFETNLVFAPVPSRAEVFENGGVAISQTMRDAATVIAAGNTPQTNAALAALDGAIDHIADVAARVGLNAARLDRLAESSFARSITVREERSKLEDTDLSSAIAELNGMTLTLEAAQAAFARINRRTLMDFLG